MKPKFRLGQLVFTSRIDEELIGNKQFAREITSALQRHMNADWGEMHEEDIKTNNEALEIGDRIFASYETSKGKVWIITEWDRSATTILFPDEY